MQISATILQVDPEHEGQRLDNFLIKNLKGVPKSRIYRAIRKGEVRVNKKRAKAEYKLKGGDSVRVPPIRVAEQDEKSPVPSGLQRQIEENILYEDKQILILNKPVGIAVHAGTGIKFGVIEILRAIRPKCKFLDLVHRLDRQTSGCLVISKKSSILKELHEQFKEKSVDKRYLALLHGRCQFKRTTIDLPLSAGHMSSGERIVRTSSDGKSAVTTFRVIAKLPGCTLVEANPLTGRMHQIRVHAQALGHPIVGDEKYGDREQDKKILPRYGKRMYLHCSSLSFSSASLHRNIAVGAVLDQCFGAVIHAI